MTTILKNLDSRLSQSDKNNIIWLSIDMMAVCKVKKLRARKEIEKEMNDMINFIKKMEKNYELILIPTFSYDFPRTGEYDSFKTETKVSAFASYVMKKYPEQRSINPFYSFLAFGKSAQKFLKMQLADSVGTKSPFNYLHGHESLMISIGHHFVKALSDIHEIEYQLGAPYRKIIKMNGQMKRNGENMGKGSYNFYGRIYDKCDFSGLTTRGLHALKEKCLYEADIIRINGKTIIFYKVILNAMATYLLNANSLEDHLINGVKEGNKIDKINKPIEAVDSNKLYIEDLILANQNNKQ